MDPTTRETSTAGDVHAPLAGRIVLDLSTQLPGPYATMLLRALGARVIKVEPPDGDPARRIDPAMFDRINAGKELIRLDLKTAEGRRLVHALSRNADVFIEGYRPGVAERLHVDYARLVQQQPGIVYCSLSGFGRTGPLANLPAHDLNLVALAGGLPDGPEHRQIGLPVIDLAAGTNAALSIVAALAGRDGSGVYLDMSLLDAAVVWSAVKQTGWETEPTYGVFATSDGERLAVSVMEDSIWLRLARALGWHDWERDPRLRSYQQRKRCAEEISGRLRRTLASSPRAHWLVLAARHDLPITPVLNRRGALSHDQVVLRRPTEAGLLQAPLPLELRVPVTTAAGVLDANGPALRREFGNGTVTRNVNASSYPNPRGPAA